jgi:hypothetical protein
LLATIAGYNRAGDGLGLCFSMSHLPCFRCARRRPLVIIKINVVVHVASGQRIKPREVFPPD